MEQEESEEEEEEEEKEEEDEDDSEDDSEQEEPQPKKSKMVTAVGNRGKAVEKAPLKRGKVTEVQSHSIALSHTLLTITLSRCQSIAYFYTTYHTDRGKY
jgi:NADH:ubiquinone oxidoreductase subunit E